MAQSPTHKFGQIIGDLLEKAVRPPLENVAQTHRVYLDFKHSRPARSGRKKVVWEDNKGNSHELDYVIEEGGSETVIGKPRAFIETAWRSVHEHSRNKAQEIQGAVLALSRTYTECHPFLGVLLAGVFTYGSLDQLRSNGFHVVYVPYEHMLAAFATVGISAAFDEDTADEVVATRIAAYEALIDEERGRICESLRQFAGKQLESFLSDLCEALDRATERIYVTTLHGRTKELATANDAINFLNSYREAETVHPFVRYEIGIRYTNGDEVEGVFRDKATAIRFIRDNA